MYSVSSMCIEICIMYLLISYLTLFSGRYDYSHSYRDSFQDGSTVPAEFGNNMVYYYDDGNRVQMYSVEENLLKGYIKRQM